MFGAFFVGQLGLAGVFDHPKPVGLVEKLIRITTSENDLVVDFFAGACTKLQKDAKESLDLEDRETPEDLGFKIFKLAPPNIQPWTADGECHGNSRKRLWEFPCTCGA